MAANLPDNDITIDLCPLLEQDSSDEVITWDSLLETESQAHDQVFRWRHDAVATKMNSYLNQNSATFQKGGKVGMMVFGQWQNRTRWSNMNDPIDVTKIPSLQRILLIRDVTKRLRQIDAGREIDDKILTGINAFTEIFFKLDYTNFSIRLQPYNNQPGNGFLTMKGTGGEYDDTHWKMEKFYLSFKKLRASEIDSVVTKARRRGSKITMKDLEDFESVKQEKMAVKKRMAEELTYFMLKYDLEVACRLQRPFVNASRAYDVLPIGIGIALMHRINSRSLNGTWQFFSTRDQEIIQGVVENASLFEFSKTTECPATTETIPEGESSASKEKMVISTRENAEKRKDVLVDVVGR
ncbi:uncharacterized protein LOC124197540 isoform X2 [Daphnia pulex]|nr:uncharacterized protein LOC124197540 isoform X2 [Daphnia pulex]